MTTVNSKTEKRELQKPDIGEMLIVARAARDAGYQRVEIDPADLVEALELAYMYMGLCE